MTAWWPVAVARAFVQFALTDEATIVAELHSEKDIYPNRKPMLDDDDQTRRQLTHEFAGPMGSSVARPTGASIARVGMYWDITGWQPSASQASLEALMTAVMKAMVGENMMGLSHSFAYKTRPFYISIDFDSPQAVPVDLDPGGAWAPERGRFTIEVSPR
jgi:hypothetical protein